MNGGFNRGREDIRKNWVVNSDHIIELTLFWDNTQMMEQCDPLIGGPDIAWSDGKVYYVRTFDATTDYDGDGCRNEAELQFTSGSETSGGRRDPAYPWDYYDVSDPKDGRIDLLNDILGVVNHFAPSGAPPYNAYYDRGRVIGPNGWDRAGPDGAITLLYDILGVIGQFAHDCN